MKLVEINGNLGLIVNNKKVFVHGRKVPFIMCVQSFKNKVNIFSLQAYKIMENNENNAVIEFFDVHHSCVVNLKSEEKKVILEFSADTPEFMFNLKTEEDDTIYFDNEIVNKRIFVQSEKEKIIPSSLNLFGKNIKLNRTEVVCKKHLPTNLCTSSGSLISFSEEPQSFNAEDSLALMVTSNSSKFTVTLNY